MSAVLTATIYDQIEDVARDLYIRALTDIPKDVRIGLKSAKNAETAAQQKTAEKVMLTVLENVRVADEKAMMVCQDTGLPIYRVRVGNQLQLDMVEVKNRLKIGAERATRDYPLRSNTVHPITRKHTYTNTGQGMPVIKFDFVEGDTIEIQMAPKGSGSENMSFLKMLVPSEGIKGIYKFVLQCVFDSGANPCPPVIVGIGLGGTSDVASNLAKEASCFRRIGTHNPDETIAKMERELLELINQTGIGPQGLGGATTAMAVNIEWAHTHISQNPVAVNMQCWRGERAGAIIDADGNVTRMD
ncbi:MAG TPA: fumarate hydratase [Tepidisphaeraceae bacterium]|jgi:fumarate hydratase subunit alpha/L(+)-tartrate dehydratase alpha subunit